VKTSQSAINKLKSIEQFSAKAYLDPPGNSYHQYSIGYGHQIGKTDSILLNQTITTVKGEQLLRADVAPLEAQLNNAKYKFNQNQFDGLVIFGYNTGSGSLAKCIDTWNATHDINKVTAEMAKYTKVQKTPGVYTQSPTLEQRRAFEISWMQRPVVPILAIFVGSLLALYAFS